MKDYYQILGVPKSATQAEIKNAYRRLAKQHHPDVNKGESKAEEKFKDISEAYNLLSDPEKRKQYDLFSQGGYGGGFQGAPGGGFGGFGGYGGAGGATNVEFGDFGDIFEELFNMGGVKRGQQRYRSQTQHEQAVKGDDTNVQLEISFFEAVEGSTRKISIKRNGKVENITVKIPAGVNNGSKVRVAGKGQSGQHGGKDGDLFLTIQVASHPQFWREGADIYCEMPVTIYQALLGGSITVPTISGQAQMKIPEGTASGQKFRLKGKGAPVLGKTDRGDEYIIIKIVPPKKISKPLRIALEELAEKHPYTAEEV